MLRILKQRKGIVTLEVIGASFIFLTFLVFATAVSIQILDTTRQGRGIGMATEMVDQILSENASPSAGQIGQVADTLLSLGYIREPDDYRVFIRGFENDPVDGHKQFYQADLGPNTTVASKVLAHDTMSGSPGIEIGENIYQIDIGEALYSVEIYSANRGKATGGNLPNYEIGVVISTP